MNPVRLLWNMFLWTWQCTNSIAFPSFWSYLPTKHHNNLITHNLWTRNKEQVCALTAPSGLWRLTFAPGQPENLSFFHRNNFLGTLDFTGTDPWLNPSIFLRAQPWRIVHRQKTSNINCITIVLTFANPAPVPKFWSIPLPVLVAKPNPISPKRFANPTLYFGIPFRGLPYISTTISTLSLAFTTCNALSYVRIRETAWPSGQRFGTRNPAVPGSSPALATCWICSRSFRVQILGHACK